MNTFFQNINTLLIIVAMDVEEKALLQGREYQKVTYGQRFSIHTKEFSVGYKRIIVANSGVGLVNAALVVAFLHEHVAVDAILALGVGGALCPSLKMGDTVIAKQIIQHDSISSTEIGNKLIAAGELTLSAPEDQQVDPIISCHKSFITWLSCLFEDQQSDGTVRIGTILSGSEFVANPKRKKELNSLCEEALLVEMEAGAIAQMARKLKIPFAVVKTVADHAEPEKSISQDYKDFLKQASEHSAIILKGILGGFGENKLQHQA